MSQGDERLDVLRRRLERERRARAEAEAIAERATGELYNSVIELEGLNRELSAANQAIREFVGIASHDLRNPLTTIIGFAQLLRDELAEGNESGRQRLEVILRQGGQMHRLVEDLLILSRLEAGAVEPMLAECEVAEELRRSLEQLGEDGRSIVVEGNAELVVRADRDHFQRILGNYLTNALKYGEPPIATDTAREGAFVAVCVKDQGPGVPADFVDRLFARFARADSARTSPGTGLGLSIVRGLAEANGGEAWYEPNQPHGSCFGVTLPLALPEAAPPTTE